jgi:hypothetical protein
MPFERLIAYLKFSLASSLALVDSIVCMADTDTDGYFGGHLLEKALALSSDVRGLPENCTMRDGRKWKSIPFVIFSNAYVPTRLMDFALYQKNAQVYPVTEPGGYPRCC